ncbi:MAG: hypothetical protein R2909_08660 [Gemmatimonadales bacterium]
MPFHLALRRAARLRGGDPRLAAHATALAERDRVKLLELRSQGRAAARRLAVSHRKITVVLDLPGFTDALLKQFPSKLRSQVRRPFKEGFAVRHGRDQVEPFYQVFSRHMRDLGTPVMPRGFFERIADGFGDDAPGSVAAISGD